MKQNRREFLIKSGAALTMTAIASQFRHFGLMSAHAAANPPSDYRALVCISMLGGNDGNNSIIPMHADASVSSYAAYHALRNVYGLAIPQNTLLPFNVPRMNNLLYGMHPAFGVGPYSRGLYELYTQNKVALVMNVGTLAKPTTKAQMYDFTHPKPYNLYSHSDQAAQHQTGRSDRQVFSG